MPSASVVDERVAEPAPQINAAAPAGRAQIAAQDARQDEGAPDSAGSPAASAKATAKISPPRAVQSAPEPAKYDVNLIGRRNVGNGLNFYSLEREIALGYDLARQVEQSTKLVTDPEINQYINRIGQNLVRNSDSRVPFTIKVIDSGEVNAFALPGGFFYVDAGLILAADSESELAAVMAHEIAHVAARHATKNMTKQQIWNMASIPLMFIGGPAAYAIAEVASIAVPLGFLKFSRDAEREADMLGLQYDYAAGYDPQAFIQFFERLKAEEKQKHSKIAKMFSTHPMTADRITAAQDEIRTYLPDRESYVVDTSDFAAMKARLIALQGGNRLNADSGDNRPVLRKHDSETNDHDLSKAQSTQQDAPSSQPTSQDDGPPTLKRTDKVPN
ncbi:MAG TPA: M48 family metalloprotease [Candidatus Eisenbacteria bacterium]|nr:M48 family metalloprotease [Candidatus Eisenbacteria bacterium]